MPSVDLVVSTPVPTDSPRVRQLEALFDVPTTERSELTWRGELPIEELDWNVGLIVGPSGSGKSTIARHLFRDAPELEWSDRPVVEDFDPELSMDEIAAVCQAVGFNTIPSWMRPYRVLSTGERFRVELARRMLELPDPVVVDEFTSVVDRQVAKIGSHAVQKYIRRRRRRFIAVTCHYDVEEWLNPDWVLDVATMDFRRRRLRRRPRIECTVEPVEWEVWRTFAPFHYLTASLSRTACCYALHVDGRPVSFAGFMHRMRGGGGGHRVRNRGGPIWGCSRLVTLPDWQGLGLAFALIDTMGAAYKAVGMRCRTYPAHPSLVRSFDRSPVWALKRRPGRPRQRGCGNRYLKGKRKTAVVVRDGTSQGRPCGVFEYCGPAMEEERARRLLGGHYGV